MDKQKQEIVLILVLFCLTLKAGPVFALEIAYPPVPGAMTPQEIIEKIKTGEIPSERALPLYAQYLFNLSLMIAGFLVLGAVALGGVKYLISVGNVGKMKEGREQVASGILGLIIIFASYTLISVINPQLLIFVVGTPIPEEPLLPDIPVVEDQTPVYVEIPLGWLIDRVKAKSKVARDQAEDVAHVGAEQNVVTHISLKELAECLDILTKECKCDRITEDSPYDSSCSPYSDDPEDDVCVDGVCREPCDRCVPTNICHSLDGYHPQSLFADLCTGVPVPGEPLLPCAGTGQCNLRALLTAKQKQFDILIQQLWEERADAERARDALRKELSKLELAEALMRDSLYPSVNYQNFIALEDVKGEKLGGWEHIEPVRVSSYPGEGGTAIVPPHDCRSYIPELKHERTPSCIYCPYGEQNVLSCEMFEHIDHSGRPECTTEQAILDAAGEIAGGWKWFGLGVFPQGSEIRYNGGTYTVPAGGVQVCIKICNHNCSNPEGGSESLGIPKRYDDDPASFYIPKKGNEDLITIVENTLAVIQSQGLGSGPGGASPGEPALSRRCPEAMWPNYVANWDSVKGSGYLSQAESAIDAAANATGVRKALILALISWESGFNPCAGSGHFPCDMCYGEIDGGCYEHSFCSGDFWLTENCGRYQELWQGLTGDFTWGTLDCGDGVWRRAVQMPLSAANEWMCGGAMGPAQAMAYTWKDFWKTVWTTKNPWNLTDAYLFAAKHLEDRGGADSKDCLAEINATQSYVGKSPKTLDHAYCIVQLANHIAKERGYESCAEPSFYPPPPGPSGPILPPSNGDILPVELYCQNDPTWGDKVLDGGQKMERWGCNITSFAMILRYLVLDYDPGNIADFVYDEGLWSPGSGLIEGNRGLFRDFREEKDLSYDFSDISAQDVDDELDHGHPVFTGCTNFDNGSYQHWIVIKGIVGNDIYIGDPYCGWSSQGGSPYYVLTKQQFEQFLCGIYYVSFSP